MDKSISVESLARQNCAAILRARQAAKTDARDGDFKCEICGIFLPSYQALGGHKANHTFQARRAKAEKEGVEGSATPSTKPRKEVVEGSARVLRCGECGITFRSAQALGGHKKIHNNNNNNNNKHKRKSKQQSEYVKFARKEEMKMKTGSSSGVSQEKVLDFDLNN